MYAAICALCTEACIESCQCVNDDAHMRRVQRLCRIVPGHGPGELTDHCWLYESFTQTPSCVSDKRCCELELYSALTTAV